MYSTIPVAAQSETSVCGRVLAGIASSNPPWNMVVCLSVMIIVYCQTEALRRTDHSSRGVQLDVVCLNVFSKSYR